MHASPKQRRIAVVVIHGIGFQKPFDTLDKVAAGVVEAAETVFGYEKTEVAIHDFGADDATPSAGYTSDFWERNYFEVTAEPPGSEAATWRFTLLEAYWGHHRETTLPPAQARQWLVRRLAELERARFYLCRRRFDNQTMLRLINPDDPEDAARVGAGDREVSPWQRRVLRFALHAAGLLSPLRGLLGRIVSLAYLGLLSRIRWQDVVAYITTDPQNPLYRVRGEILDEVQARLEAIADWASDPQAGVDGVVVVGHSLGSVILVDTINRMRRRPAGRQALGRLEPRTMLVLLGSPVEHILRLVLFRLDPAKRFRNATIFARVAWRLRRGFGPVRDGCAIGGLEGILADPLFARVPVFNFHAFEDPISSEITTLHDIRNIACDYDRGLDAHQRYWDDPSIYRMIFEALHGHLHDRGTPVT